MSKEEGAAGGRSVILDHQIHVGAIVNPVRRVEAELAEGLAVLLFGVSQVFILGGRETVLYVQ